MDGVPVFTLEELGMPPRDPGRLRAESSRAAEEANRRQQPKQGVEADNAADDGTGLEVRLCGCLRRAQDLDDAA